MNVTRVCYVMCVWLMLWMSVTHVMCILFVIESMTNEPNTLRLKVAVIKAINGQSWSIQKIKNSRDWKYWRIMNNTCWWTLDWMELDPLSYPHVVNIVESILVVNNVRSSSRINIVNVCERSQMRVWQLWPALFLWLWMPRPHKSTYLLRIRNT